MGKKKFITTNSYNYLTAPETADIKNYRASLPVFDVADSSINYLHNVERNEANNRLDGIFNADYSPQQADALKISVNNEITQSQGQAFRDDAHDRRLAKTGALGGLAGMTKPQLVQTGSTQTQSGGALGGILSGLSSSVLGNPSLMGKGKYKPIGLSRGMRPDGTIKLPKIKLQGVKDLNF